MTRPPSISCVRWAARLLSLAQLGIVAVIVIAEGGFNPFRLTLTEAALAVLLWIAVAGLVAAWRYELLGGMLAVGGVLLFHALDWYISGGLPKTWFFATFGLTGILFLAAARLDRSGAPRIATGASQ